MCSLAEDLEQHAAALATTAPSAGGPSTAGSAFNADLTASRSQTTEAAHVESWQPASVALAKQASLPETPSQHPLPPEAAAALEELKKRRMLSGPHTPASTPPAPPPSSSVPPHVFAMLQWQHLSAAATVAELSLQQLDVRLHALSLTKRGLGPLQSVSAGQGDSLTSLHWSMKLVLLEHSTSFAQLQNDLTWKRFPVKICSWHSKRKVGMWPFLPKCLTFASACAHECTDC